MNFPDPQFLAKSIAQFTRKLLAPLKDRIVALEQEVEALKSSGVKFCGAHQRALTYTEGSIVTDSAGGWICVAEKTRAIPGASSDWQPLFGQGADVK